MSSNRLIYDTCAYETDMTETANQITQKIHGFPMTRILLIFPEMTLKDLFKLIQTKCTFHRVK